MNIGDITDRLTQADVHKFAASPIWGHSTDGLDHVQWPDCLLSTLCIHRAWPRLPEVAALTLITIIREFGAMPFKEEQLLVVIPPGSIGVNYRVGLLKLLEAGIVFAVRKAWGEKLYFIPQDSFVNWYRIIFLDDILPPIEELNVSHIMFSPDEEEVYKPMLGLQLIHTLAEMQRTGMKLTSKGYLTKRTVEKASKHIHLRAAEMDRLHLSRLSRDGKYTGYPIPFAFFLELFFIHGWITQSQESVEIRLACWENWLSLPSLSRESKLLHTLIQHFAFQNTQTAHTAVVMCQLLPMKWYRIADILLSLHKILGDSNSAITDDNLIKDWCNLLSAFGWLEMARLISGEPIVRWLINPQLLEDSSILPLIEGESIRITPDGEIFVYPDSSGQIRWLLENIALRKLTDRVTVYKLDSALLLRMDKLGLSCESIINRLEEASGEELPHTVRIAIASLKTTEFCQEEEGPIQLSVQLASEGKSMTNMSPFPEPPSLYAYDLLLEWPSYKSLFVGLDEVPTMWIKQLRSYHHSTKRELLERALSWRTAVKLNYRGSVQSFVPERIEGDGVDWAVVGQFYEENGTEQLRLKPTMWQEMMLVIPIE
ncbi:hypothetical protein Back11_09730 [Paenibacillus baekrokdamisoli]|uniref:Uncharacterized protein n=1 Tax=Paenibacillus baekrokdamisoli TaxID=1712516 RepID=A0A3G9J754_9BACL|nr:hypothetical protein [Paenibacillus baekrokdamisoli]MBB3067180.1 hypothetical protein [Paenibacillus baekrokdamisoli]BBH19628.1 hypothetical protein Back11_09730 [Paenibacillus baekrokdamisoli]